ncbi:unnamed protein product [Meganyctiphanes norvegica]|uniref:LolA-like domain-containing protein n=1 Tax=Meganyctiphanes norvegica TaxID=48144 RepID=A0AAV2PUX7_MEGNR
MMARIKHRIGLLSLAVLVSYGGRALAIPDPNVCIVPEISCGPIPPTPPDMYVTYVEVTDLIANETWYAQEFYDPDQQMLAVYEERKDRIIHTVFYYQADAFVVMEVMTGMDSGGSQCQVGSIDSDTPWMVGYETADGDTVFILSPSQALAVGGDYKYAWSEETKIRQIPVNRWDACMEYPPVNATMQLNYAWSDPMKFTDMEGFLHERPIENHIHGITYTKDGIPINVNNLYSFMFFDVDPYWPQHQWAFEIPSDMVCKGLPNLVPAPGEMANQYSMGMETIIFSSFSGEKEYMENLMSWYDYERKLSKFESVMNPNTFEGQLVGQNQASAIQDFTAGVEYIIDQTLGNCTVTNLTTGIWDGITDANGNLVIKNPMQTWGMGYTGENLTYYGTKISRGIPVDVWAIAFDQEQLNGTLEDAIVVEYHYLKSDWVSIAGPINSQEKEYPVPIMVTISQNIQAQNLDAKIGVIQNIYAFDENPPTMNVFDITPCFIGHDKQRRFEVSFPSEFRDQFEKNEDKFTENVWYSIASEIGVSEIRIQKLLIEFRERSPALVAEFTLVDLPPVEGREFPDTIGPPLEQAIETMYEDQPFMVIIQDDSLPTPGKFVIMKSIAGSLHEVFPENCTKSDHLQDAKGELQDSIPHQQDAKGQVHDSIAREQDKPIEQLDYEKSKAELIDEAESNGGPLSSLHQTFTGQTKSATMYKPGDMAGMAFGMLFLGLILGCISTHFVLLKFGITTGSDIIPMTAR